MPDWWAIIQYVAILAYIVVAKDMMSLPHEALAYGGFSIADQISRVLVMLIMTILAVILVVRNMNLIKLSSVDPLTGLFNRNYFNVRFKQESYRSQRQEYALSVIMLDLDHFKQINDEYGHLTGDHVLRVIAGQLQDLCRASDVVSRFGGEEFVIIMPDSDYAQTLARAEQIRKTYRGT